ncbi:MAG: response regulator [Archangium sp.]|nr:response regulator [Archangium sp.]MDP3571901.1 response regulator [Archangium sp.]
MHAWRRVSGWISRQVPADVPPEEVPRAEVFLITGWLAIALSLLSCVAAFFKGLSWLAMLNALDVLAAAMIIWLFRSPFPRRRRFAVKFFLGFYTLSLSLGSLTVDPMDATTLCFLFLLPLVAALMLEPQQTFPWIRRSMLGGGLALIAGHFSLTSHQLDPDPLFTHLLNFIGGLALAMALLKALASDRERAITRIRETERAKTAFFANVGHDIRTPMNGVMGMADVLLEQPTLAGEHREMVQVIRSSGSVLLGLVDDVLDLARLEASQLVLRPVPVALRQLTTELDKLWAPVAERKGLRLTVEVDGAVPPAAMLDGLRARQILNNLINNAVKFTQTGQIWLRLASSEENLSFVVQDTGIGISDTEQIKLFARFTQADDENARGHQGSGLGLALSRQLARHMSGSLVLESEKGVGSRFTLSLPLERTALPAIELPNTRQLPQGLSVLVVDDNPINRLVAQRLLDKNGCQVQCACDGRAALEASSLHKFDLVLMDVHMPQMDGLEATRQIRARDGDALRIIGFSASAAQADVDNCRAAGMNDFLAKPITQERLLTMLLRHL